MNTERNEARDSGDPVLIVGGGVSGLSLAYYLKSRGVPSRLFEASSRLGGNIRTVRHDGFTYDVGPDSFVKAKPEAEALCRELGLGASLIEPLEEGRRVYVAFDGALHAMPEGLSLGVPTRPLALLESPLLSAVGKARAFCEPFIARPRHDRRSDESIAHFLERRLGSEMATRLAAPLLAGVFAGDAERLSLRASFPQVLALEENRGSLFFGVKAPRGGPGATQELDFWGRLTLLVRALVEGPAAVPSPFLSLEGGLGQLVETLTDALAIPGVSVSVRKNCRVDRVCIDAGRVRGVELASGERIEGERVVLAGPPWAAARLLRPAAPALAAHLEEIQGAPTATVFFGLSTRALERNLDGSGFIVPPGEGAILASTWTSRKWPGRAPEGAELVRAFVGGARRVGPDIARASDAELIATSLRELQRFMGHLGPVRFARVYRYDKGTPQPELGHLERIASLERALESIPGLLLLGPGYSGVGIPDCIRSAKKLADRWDSELAS